MPPWVIDIVTLLIVLGMTYALLSEGVWGAALMFFDVLFAGLITFNFYEPLAAMLAQNADFLSGFADTLCILVLFIVSLLILRLTTDSLAPGMVRFPSALYWLGGLVFGFGAAAMTAGIILLAFHAAPVHKKVLGVITYDYKPPFGMALDHHWLGVFQHSSGIPFARFSDEYPSDPERFFGKGAGLNLFDPRAEWLIRHQEARPYGEGSILGGDADGAAAGGTAAPTPSGPMGSGPGPMGGQSGPGIPGGTAGAAIGLAPTNP